MKRAAVGLSVVVLVALVAGLSGCVPGRRGWSCDVDSDCNPGLVCTAFDGVWSSKYCVGEGESRIGSRETYGWISLILVDGFAGFFSLIILIVAVVGLGSWFKELGWLPRVLVALGLACAVAGIVWLVALRRSATPMERMTALRDEMCACRDGRCAKDVTERLEEDLALAHAAKQDGEANGLQPILRALYECRKPFNLRPMARPGQ